MVEDEEGQDLEAENSKPDADEIQTKLDGADVFLNFHKLLEEKSLISKKGFDWENYTRGCKWSPDGLCILVCNRDHNLRIFEPQCDPEKWDEAVKVRECGTIYDFHWYPLMSSSDPDRCVFACSSQSQPIHLFDAFNGRIRATYRIYDHLDEVVSARSLCFSSLGDKLYAGRNDEIRVFDVNVPGRDCETYRTYNKRDGGLGGIVSSIAVNPATHKVLAAGSYSKGVAVFIADDDFQPLCFLDGQKGGVTQLQFTPDGTKLCAGGRKDDEILIWDLRNPGRLYAAVNRKVDTNQRIYFDIDASGKFLASGGTDGSLTVWDMTSIDEDAAAAVQPHKLKTAFRGGSNLLPDCVNGVNFHPNLPCLATCTGQRHCTPATDSSSESSSDDQSAPKADSSLYIWSLQ